jgi:hypothetical protein
MHCKTCAVLERAVQSVAQTIVNSVGNVHNAQFCDFPQSDRHVPAVPKPGITIDDYLTKTYADAEHDATVLRHLALRSAIAVITSIAQRCASTKKLDQESIPLIFTWHRLINASGRISGAADRLGAMARSGCLFYVELAVPYDQGGSVRVAFPSAKGRH